MAYPADRCQGHKYDDQGNFLQCTQARGHDNGCTYETVADTVAGVPVPDE